MTAINQYQPYQPFRGYYAQVPMGIIPRPNYSQYVYYPVQHQMQTGSLLIFSL